MFFKFSTTTAMAIQIMDNIRNVVDDQHEDKITLGRVGSRCPLDYIRVCSTNYAREFHPSNYSSRRVTYQELVLS